MSVRHSAPITSIGWQTTYLITITQVYWITTIFARSDLLLNWTRENWYNPSAVQYQGGFISAAKLTLFKKDKAGKVWWVNKLYMCQGDSLSATRWSCMNYNPWREEYHECLFDNRVRGGRMETSGLGDVKLWRWPGRGVYAIFGRKPERTAGNASCSGQLVYQQFIAQVRSEVTKDASLGADKKHTTWFLDSPLPLTLAPSHQYSANTSIVMEKNWMPFGYASHILTTAADNRTKNEKDIATSSSPEADGKGHVEFWAGLTDNVHHRSSGGISPGLADEKLMVVYTVMPHAIYEVTTDGMTTPRYVTHTSPAFMGSFDGLSVHGGPAIAFIPKHLSSTGEEHFLGIFHSIEQQDGAKTRVYRHFAYRFLSVPPFNITAVSDELPLVFTQEAARSKSARIAFVCGLFVSWDGTITISYGSSDIRSRALVMKLKELDAMFSGQVQRVQHSKLAIKHTAPSTLMKKNVHEVSTA